MSSQEESRSRTTRSGVKKRHGSLVCLVKGVEVKVEPPSPPPSKKTKTAPAPAALSPPPLPPTVLAVASSAPPPPALPVALDPWSSDDSGDDDRMHVTVHPSGVCVPVHLLH